jgi:PAS domain S-box-containing protein
VVWRNDARDLVRQVEGLQQLQWVGPDYHLHWSEGARRRGWVESMDVRTNSPHTRALMHSAERGSTYVTEPREHAPGESAFDVFVPVSREGRFDGFISATFSNRNFFGDDGEDLTGKSFAFSVQYGAVTFFDDVERGSENAEWRRDGSFKVHDRRWSFTVAPTQQFVDEQLTLMPLIVLLSGLLIAALSASLVRYVLIVHLKTTRLQASARALTESEERYELALRGMSVGLWDWNIATNAVFLSPRCRAMLGIGEDFQPKYTGFLGRLHPEDRGRVEKSLSGHFKQQQPFDVEFRIRRDDGEYIWVHIYGQAQFDDKGYADRMAGSMQDITQKKQQEQQLERSGAQLRMLVENAPAAVAMFDKDMRYLMTSRRWIQDYGLEQRDIIGMSHYDVFPEIRAMPRWIDIHRRALRGERFDIHEDSWVRADGQQEWNQWAIHPWTDADGEVGGLVMFTEVITARKLAEAALRTSEAMNRAAMDRAPIGKALVDPVGRFLKVNPALCQLLGYTEVELLDSDIQRITHPDDLAANLSQLRALIEGRTISYQVDKRYIHRDGRVIWVQLSVSAVRRADGAVDFLVAQFQDITERKVIDRMKDEFVAVVNNELRTPLAALRDSLGEIAARRDVDLPDSLQRLFDNCRQSSDRLGRLVEEMLDLEKLADGQLRIDFKDERIAEITRNAIAVNESYARIKLADIDPDLTVYVDTACYSQVLSNLLSNAARFSPPGSPIDVGAELRGDWVRVSVRDRGEGVPEEFRARIFGKFAHADSVSARTKGGAGLGLYITRQLVEQMRGKVGFVSQLGSGSTFWVEFPRMSRGEQRRSA